MLPRFSGKFFMLKKSVVVLGLLMSSTWSYAADKAIALSIEAPVENLAAPASAQELKLEGVVRILSSSDAMAVNGGENHGGSPVVAAKLRREWASQQWEIEAAKDGSYRLMNKWTGLFLSSCSQQVWTEVCLQEPVASWTSQRWFIEPLGEQRYRLRNAWSNLYMQSASFEWTSLVQTPSSESTEQIFIIKSVVAEL